MGGSPSPHKVCLVLGFHAKFSLSPAIELAAPTYEHSPDTGLGD